ncbi:MAG: hypothetical protein ACRC0L_13245 [Angustibacter sp.]
MSKKTAATALDRMRGITTTGSPATRPTTSPPTHHTPAPESAAEPGLESTRPTPTQAAAPELPTRRTTIDLDPDRHKTLRTLAAHLDTTQADLWRALLDQLASNPDLQDALAARLHPTR